MIIDDASEPSAFTATNDQNRGYNTSNVVIFDVIVTNIGNNYLAETSTYVCPRQGIYLFSVTILNLTGYEMIADLMYGDKRLGTARAENDNYNQATVTVVTECAAGEQVWVKSNGDNYYVHHYRNANSFSGYLLRPY